MTYWDALGRSLAAEDTKMRADYIADYLSCAGLDASVSLSPEGDLYAVTVPADQQMTADRLMQSYYAKQARVENKSMNESYYREHCLAQQPDFMPQEEKFRTDTHSSMFYTVCGAIVFVLAIVHFFLAFGHHTPEDLRACVLELMLACIFILFGLSTQQKVRILQDRILEENAFTDGIIRWCTNTYSAEQIDNCIRAACEESDLSPECLSVKRRDLIQDYILREYNISDKAYLDYVTDTIYKKFYYPNSVSGFFAG